MRGFYTAHGSQQYLRGAEKDKGNAQIAQILRPFGDYQWVRRKNADDLLGEKRAHDGQKRADRQGELQPNAGDAANVERIALSPILCAENGDGNADAICEHLQKRLNLRSHINAGNRIISQFSDHEIVGEGYQKGNQILQSDGNSEADEVAVIIAVPCQNSLHGAHPFLWLT